MSTASGAPRETLELGKEKHFLGDKKFAKHLESLTQEELADIDLSDEEAKAEEYKLFKKTEDVREGLGKMWPAHMEEALGIKLGKEGKAAIDAHLRREMRENPEKIEEFAEKLETFRVHREKIRKLEATLESQRTNVGSIEARGQAAAKTEARMKERMDKAGIWSRLRGHYGEDKKAAREAAAEFSKAQAELAELQAKQAEAQALIDQHKGEHAGMRDEVVKELLQEAALASLVRQKVDQKFTKMLRPGGSKDFRAVGEAGALLKKYAQLAEDADAEEEMGVEDITEKVDGLAERRAKDEVKKAIRAIKPGYRLEKLQEKLDGFVNLNPIGSKEHEDARDFVLEVFEEQEEELDEAMKTDPKAILKRAMLGTVKNRVMARYEAMEEEETA